MDCGCYESTALADIEILNSGITNEVVLGDEGDNVPVMFCDEKRVENLDSWSFYAAQILYSSDSRDDKWPKIYSDMF